MYVVSYTLTEEISPAAHADSPPPRTSTIEIETPGPNGAAGILRDLLDDPSIVDIKVGFCHEPEIEISDNSLVRSEQAWAIIPILHAAFLSCGTAWTREFEKEVAKSIIDELREF